MKILTNAVIAALGLAFGASAFAQTSAPELTRAQVRAQLVQAEADGLLPTNRNNYPPSPAVIQHNREMWAAAHHDDVSTTASASSPANSIAGD
ncbi:DUF4148 domain-containing protein [Paraburkholderia phosphatilytica]|uniref:DUF4148 domain-containing protein n=1 Tax=Paraburkholderia phosphatilytica TaxID=2282883 RepID=UPI000E4CA1EE|nr:DUF4148 domain-containing protein [Paraburkholderia phosphatilytica]